MVEPAFLIADDDLADRTLTRRLLRKLFPGAPVLEFDGSYSAPGELDPLPTVALIDYYMPLCSGLDLVEELRRRWPHTACIVMTGQGDEEIAKTAIKAGAFDYVSKNRIGEESLRRIIESAFSWQRMQIALHEQREETELFAAVLLHDIKAPVRSISFFSEEIERTLSSEARESVSEDLRLLRRSTAQISSLLDSLANHMRVSRDEPFERHTLREIVDTALCGLDRMVTESGVSLLVDVEEASLDCSKAQLVQLLQNLIANAIKFGRASAPKVVVSGHLLEGGRVALSVADNGIGIEKKYHQRIFEPFKRGAAGAETEGTGLGLATCMKVARRHGGSIRCESTVGEGSCFVAEIAASPQHGA